MTLGLTFTSVARPSLSSSYSSAIIARPNQTSLSSTAEWHRGGWRQGGKSAVRLAISVALCAGDDGNVRRRRRWGSRLSQVACSSSSPPGGLSASSIALASSTFMSKGTLEMAFSTAAPNNDDNDE